MRFTVASILLFLVVSPHASAHQSTPSQRKLEKAPKGKQIISSERLLQSAYLFSRELPDDKRMNSAPGQPGLDCPNSA
jgi:hypothetical protein